MNKVKTPQWEVQTTNLWKQEYLISFFFFFSLLLGLFFLMAPIFVVIPSFFIGLLFSLSL